MKGYIIILILLLMILTYEYYPKKYSCSIVLNNKKPITFNIKINNISPAYVDTGYVYSTKDKSIYVNYRDNKVVYLNDKNQMIYKVQSCLEQTSSRPQASLVV